MRRASGFPITCLPVTAFARWPGVLNSLRSGPQPGHKELSCTRPELAHSPKTSFGLLRSEGREFVRTGERGAPSRAVSSRRHDDNAWRRRCAVEGFCTPGSFVSDSSTEKRQPPWRMAAAVGYMTPAAYAATLKPQRAPTLRHPESSAPMPVATVALTRNSQPRILGTPDEQSGSRHPSYASGR